MMTCRRCGLEKAVTAFRPTANTKSGRENTCKVCRNAAREESRKRLRSSMPERRCPSCCQPFRPNPECEQNYCSNRCRGFGVKRSGGRYVARDGYVLVLVGMGHPMALPSRPYALEHRLVMAEAIGRSLESWEVVHHINHDKSDNRLENLALMDVAEHSRGHSLGVL